MQGLLERVAQSEYDRLASGLPYEEYLAAVGAYQASRRAVELVDTLIAKAQQIHDRTDHRNSIFYADPYR